MVHNYWLKMKLFVCIALLIAATALRTPDASTLDDHFGTPVSADLYGPKTEFTTPIAGAGSCNISGAPFFSLCTEMKTCGSCSAAPHCGWCPKAASCMPGSKASCACPDSCDKEWCFEEPSCPNYVTP
jgi:hypothetical protein